MREKNRPFTTAMAFAIGVADAAVFAPTEGARMRKASLAAISLAFVFGLFFATVASATFHTYRIEQIYSNADGTIQFAVLKESEGAPGQDLWSGHALTSTSGGTAKTFVFSHNLPSDKTSRTRVLVATEGFATLGIVTPDYVIPNHFIATPAGTLNFADVDEVGYASLPADGVMAIDRTQKSIPNVATNFAGMTGSVTAALAGGAANYEGLWWNAPAGSESGWGINFAHQGDVIFATWFTYDTSGKAWWLTMTAPKTADATYAGTLYQTAGPSFDAVPFDPSKVTASAVGSGTLHFTDNDNGTFAYRVNGIAQTKTITREVFGAVPACASAQQKDIALATNYQDLWWKSPEGSESGWGINFTHQGDIIFATWFTYGKDGKPLWLSVTANKTADKVYSGDLYRTGGPAFNAVPFDPSKITLTRVGTATLTFANGNSATFAYTVDGVSQAKPLVREVFVAPGTVCR